MSHETQALREHIEKTEKHLRYLRLLLEAAELREDKFGRQVEGDSAERIRENPLPLHQTQRKDPIQGVLDDPDQVVAEQPEKPTRWPLEHEEYQRYGRQLILPEVGLPGQLRLKNARVLIVGVGGLGCPAAAYLAAAGIGTLGLADGDTVELSNLHRQVAHSADKVGMNKADSAYQYLHSYVVEAESR